MNRLIKTYSLALLLSIFPAHSMENNTIITLPSKPFTINTVPDDVLKEICKYVCSDKTKIIDQVKKIVQLRPVCKHWYHILSPVAIRQLLNWEIDINYELMHPQISYRNGRNHYLKFIANSFKDTPNAYNQINMEYLIASFDHLGTIKTLLENGANPNFHYSGNSSKNKKHPKTLLFYTMLHNKREIFNLVLQHGGDIYQNAGNGYSILRTAIVESCIPYSIFLGLFDYIAGMYLHALGYPSIWPVIIKLNLPVKHLCSFMFSVVCCHLMYICPLRDQWPLKAIVKKYWRNLTTPGKTNHLK